MQSTNVTLALDEYIARIDHSGPLRCDAETLSGLHVAHTTRIPFENLDVLLGRPICIDLASVQRKLVNHRRGGYCFEQNALFAAVLEELGFTVTRLAARVRLGTARVLPRTHMLLKVEADEQSWIADVGFGGWGLLKPIPLVADEEFEQGVWKFRLAREGAQWVLQCPQCPVGSDQYAFTLDPLLPVDYEPANHYCSKFPQSRFLQTLTVQRPSLQERLILKDRELVTFTAAGSSSEPIPDEEALLEILRDRFGLHFPAGTSFGLKLFPS